MDWNNNLLMEINTVVGSHQEKVVCLHQSQQMCGHVAGYEKDGPDGFRPFNINN